MYIELHFIEGASKVWGQNIVITGAIKNCEGMQKKISSRVNGVNMFIEIPQQYYIEWENG